VRRLVLQYVVPVESVETGQWKLLVP
jgi:hypothetical protein